MVVGAPGGPRIINTVMQVILNVIDFGMNVQEAVDQPRIPSPVDAGPDLDREDCLAGYNGAARQMRTHGHDYYEHRRGRGDSG